MVNSVCPSFVRDPRPPPSVCPSARPPQAIRYTCDCVRTRELRVYGGGGGGPLVVRPGESGRHDTPHSRVKGLCRTRFYFSNCASSQPPLRPRGRILKPAVHCVSCTANENGVPGRHYRRLFRENSHHNTRTLMLYGIRSTIRWVRTAICRRSKRVTNGKRVLYTARFPRPSRRYCTFGAVNRTDFAIRRRVQKRESRREV